MEDKKERFKYRHISIDMMDTKILEDLGFTNAEIKVYLALLELGSATAGPIIEKSGLLETFQLTLGDDFQKDPETRDPIAALFKGLLVLNEMAQSEDVYLSLWVSQGLEALAKKS